MVYTKISMDKVLSSDPTLNISEMAEQAVIDHIQTNGCDFEDNAAQRAIEELGLDPHAAASALPQEELEKLAETLENMELNCPHKTK
jgi:hypothetical protein